MKRWMGLDVGDRTIGIAVSDLLGLTAQGLEVWRRKNEDEDIEHLRSVVDLWEITGLIVGLPRRTDGSFGPEARKVQDFAETLRDRLGIPLKMWDERFSTKAAERVLLEADVRRKNRKAVIDQVAAAWILQAFLDSGAFEGREHNGNR